MPAVLAAGSPEQRARFAGAVASEGLVGTLALSEAGGGCDPRDVATTVVADAGGYVLDGEKHFVFDADKAGELVVAARLPGTTGDEGITLVVVPAELIEAEPMVNLDARRARTARSPSTPSAWGPTACSVSPAPARRPCAVPCSRRRSP